jgi:hypothetical protein
LPGRSRRRDHFVYPHAFRDCDNLFSEDFISIADQLPGRFVPRKCFSNLLRGPRFGRVFRNTKVHHTPLVMGENDEDEQHSE